MDKKIVPCLIVLTIIFVSILKPLNAQDKKEMSKTASDEAAPVELGCVDCHKTLTGRLQEPVGQWKNSVHALVGNKCNLCHGGNPESKDKNGAKSPEYNFIGKPKKDQILQFCGRGGCHTTQLAQFKRGPHYQSVLKTNEPSCISCHGKHNIQRASPKIITKKLCTKCHSSIYSHEIVGSIESIENDLNKVQDNVNYLAENYADIESIQKRYLTTKHLFRELVHVFSSDEIQSTKKIIELQLSNLIVESKSKVALTKRLNLLYFMTIIFALLIITGFGVYAVIMFYRRR